MKKPVKWAMVIIALLVFLLVGFSIFIKIFLSGDRLKAIILPRAESMTGRKVSLDEINVSLFKGIVAKGLSVKEKDGQGDFLKISEFILSYRLLPLLKKQFVISKIEVLSPSFSVKRHKEGRYNFSDLAEKRSSPPQKPPKSEPRGLPLSITTDRLFIRNAHFTFVDETKALPEISADLDVELKGSIGQDGNPRLEFGQISLKEVKAIIGDIEVKTTGKVDVDSKTIRANLQTSIGKEALDIAATVKEYLSAPEITANLHARSLDLEKLIGLKVGKKAPEVKPQVEAMPKAEEKKVTKADAEEKKVTKTEGTRSGESPIQKYKASGRVTIDEAKYQDYRIKNLRLDYKNDKGTLRLEPLELKFSGGDAFTMEGTLNGNLQLAVDGPSSIQKSLKGKAAVKLGKGQIKESKIFDAIALLMGVPELKKPEIEEGLLNFDIKDEKVNLDGLIQSSLFKLTPKGTVDFEKRLDILPGLKISPNLTGRFSKSLTAIKFMEDEQGWKTIPIKIKGTTEKPNVTLDEEALKKQLGSGLKKGFEKLLQGRTPEEEGKPSKKVTPKDLLKELFGK